MIDSNTFVPKNIFVIGAGGTGSRVIPELAFFVRGNFSELRSSMTTIIDHDFVSAANLSRQMYFPFEVGTQSKGLVMAKRYRDLFPVKQIPEAINAETIRLIFSEEVLAEKNLIVLCADNGLVVKQVFEYMMENATEDYLVVFTGANLREKTIQGVDTTMGCGQSFAYGVVKGVPLFPAPPTETLLDIMSSTGFGPSVTGPGCGVDASSGAQTPLMNLHCAASTMTIINYFFEKGIFIPSIYFEDGYEWVYADHIKVADLFSNSLPVEEPSTESNNEDNEEEDN